MKSRVQILHLTLGFDKIIKIIYLHTICKNETIKILLVYYRLKVTSVQGIKVYPNLHNIFEEDAVWCCSKDGRHFGLGVILRVLHNSVDSLQPLGTRRNISIFIIRTRILHGRRTIIIIR